METLSMNSIISILIDFGVIGIVVSGFFEAIFLPIPMEFVFLPIALLNPDKALLYAVALILSSFLGSTVGYFAGTLIGMPLINRLISKEKFEQLKNIYSKGSFWAILTSSFTPIPYEVYVISAGVFKIGLKKFIIASLASRIIRYVPQGTLIFFYGDALLPYFKSYILLITLIVFTFVLTSKYLIKKGK
jgi:membrane protein YqaA with SNARE-associated domain